MKRKDKYYGGFMEGIGPDALKLIPEGTNFVGDTDPNVPPHAIKLAPFNPSGAITAGGGNAAVGAPDSNSTGGAPNSSSTGSDGTRYDHDYDDATPTGRVGPKYNPRHF